MTQVEYEKIIADKKFIKAITLDVNREGVEVILFPAVNAGAFDPIIEWSPRNWLHFSTFEGIRSSKDFEKSMKIKTASAPHRFKINGEFFTMKKVYDMVAAIKN